jgi:hypothetical protein
MLTPTVPTREPDWRVHVLALVIPVLMLSGIMAAVGRAQNEGGPPHPDEWDPRVAAIAAFVEDDRGLDFDHPVFVDFLTPEQYTSESTSSTTDITADEREAFEQDEAELRALGLLRGDIDLVSAFNTVTDSGTLAFYNSEDERIRVRGTDLTPSLRVTLVHELTHAVQDQAFDLDRLFEAESSQEAGALRALAEGDAIRVENHYIEDGLADAERAAYEEDYLGSAEDTEEALDSVPPAINAAFAAPYFLGEPFVLALEASGGNSGVDRAFGNPPTTDEHLLDPLSYLDGDEAKGLPAVTLEGGAQAVATSDFGALGWYIVLAERIDPRLALAAADGWGGDTKTTFTRDGVLCVRAAFVGDEKTDDDEMAAALDAWVAAMPGNARRTDDGGRLAFESCDPGIDAQFEVLGRSLDVLALPATRSVVLADALTVFDAAGATCFSAAVMGRFTTEELIDPEGTAFTDERIDQVFAESRGACGL